MRILNFHPILFALGPILYIYVHNAGQSAPVYLYLYSSLAVVAAVAVTAAAWAVFRDLRRAAIFASCFLFLFSIYGHLFDCIRGPALITRHWVIHVIIGVVEIAALAFIGRALLHTRRNLSALTQGFFVTSLAILSISLIGLAGSILQPKKAPKPDESLRLLFGGPTPARRPPVLQDTVALPDIYYIILDGYARQDVLRGKFGFDNEPFIAELERRGLAVLDSSTANYPLTFQALASALSMTYLDPIFDRLPDGSMSRGTFYALIRNARAGSYLQSRGYRFVHFQTNWTGTERSDIADISPGCRPWWLQGEFAEVLLRTTALRLVQPSVADMYRYELRTVPGFASMAGPTFVFLHLLIPHNPYIFDRHGNVRRDIPPSLQFTDKMGGWENRTAYIDQLQFVNDQALEIVDRILAGSSVRPVIILQSDHGSATGYPGTDTSAARMDAYARERLATFSAWLAPPQVQAKLRQSMSAVNTFRFLFRETWGADLPDLPDRHFVSTYQRPNDPREVTGLVAGADAKAGDGEK